MMFDPLDYATIAEIYDGIGEPERAAMVRAGMPAVDLHDGCTNSDALSAILNAVPDAKRSLSHDKDCWQRHAACLRDKIYNDLEWE